MARSCAGERVRGPVSALSTPLRELWRKRARILAATVSAGGREHREIARAANLIQQDYRDRFLIELLQNANDQAVLGGAVDSTVVVVRSEGLLAVSNAGAPLTLLNLERLSGLADSDKTGVLVGNKGVGFKAVYQVTDSPEVYSASRGPTRDLSSSLFSDFGLGIALEQDPFANQLVAGAVVEDVREYLRENDGVRASLSRGGQDPVEAVRREFEHVAGFRFPTPRGVADLERRLRELSWPDAEQDGVQTIVVLPLRDSQAQAAVSRAVAALVSGDDAHSAQVQIALLFLPGVARIVILDQVRELRWTIARTVSGAAGQLQQASVSVTGPTGVERSRHFWILRADAVASERPGANERRCLVTKALREFGLDAWKPEDPLPVAVALPRPRAGAPLVPRSDGRFCLGLPTTQPTGLPVHVDARFFGSINRVAVDFSLAYNEMLLNFAAEVFGELLDILRGSALLDARRDVTLAMYRSSGELAERVFAPGGIGDRDVVLAWGGLHFIPRRRSALPERQERLLLEFVEEAFLDGAAGCQSLPERELLLFAAEVLESMGLPALRGAPHPWLAVGADANSTSVVEDAARRHRASGVGWWEGFVRAIVGAFDTDEVAAQRWLPVGTADLAAPAQRVFLPPPVDDRGDDEEVANVPARVASKIRLMDGDALRLREEGRALTELASVLVDEGLVRHPRKTELLQDVLFPALAAAEETDPELALELFGQAVSWIASMRDASRRRLDCKNVRVPVVPAFGGQIVWHRADASYLGGGWGLTPEDERLLEEAYPGRRLASLEGLRGRLGLSEHSPDECRAAVEVLGVLGTPRILGFRSRRPPLFSLKGELRKAAGVVLGEPALEDIFGEYVSFLAQRPCSWTNRLDHDVDQVWWVDGLEADRSRRPVLDLMLRHPQRYMARTEATLGRGGPHPGDRVQAMWVFAVERFQWNIFPAERGSGQVPVRVPPRRLWRLSEEARKSAYVPLIDVVPRSLDSASGLLRTLGVASLADASVERLVDALAVLASRLDDEHLQERDEALSLANELYSRLDARLRGGTGLGGSIGVAVPLQRARRLQAVDPTRRGTLVLLDDDPVRARHVLNADSAFVVPVARHGNFDKLYEFLVSAWGAETVVRSSTAALDLHYTRTAVAAESLLDWLSREYPQMEVAAELVALLTLADGQGRNLRAAQHWAVLRGVEVVFCSFERGDVRSFYERQSRSMCVSPSLAPHEVVAATWEIVGAQWRHTWMSYSHALESARTQDFLHECGIAEVELVAAADAAGSHGARVSRGIAAALIAARAHAIPGTTLDEAATWLESVGTRPEEIAEAFERPDLVGEFASALGLRAPEGEMRVVRVLGVPWELWQDAVMRRQGERYSFPASSARYVAVRAHLVALAEEIAVRHPSIDLGRLGVILGEAATAPVPDAVRFSPLDVGGQDEAALQAVRARVSAFEFLSRAFSDLPPTPWLGDLPLAGEATLRGVRLFREIPLSAREIDAETSAAAVAHVAELLAPHLGERVDASALVQDSRLRLRTRGRWAHLYSALGTLRRLLEVAAPATLRRLSEVFPFQKTTTREALLASLPEVSAESARPQPRRSVLGVELTTAEQRSDLLSGARGVLGATLAAAASAAKHRHLVGVKRAPLPMPTASGRGGRSRNSGGGSLPRHEAELIGDIGEAFVHHWLESCLGDVYGDDCWVSTARQRYGLPASGNDKLGYDFRVPAAFGELFGVRAPTSLVEVKATATDGAGAFPMSRAEWEEAQRCHEGDGREVYVLVRVFEADAKPRIGDVVFDPFGAFRRREVHIAGRDVWVTVSKPLIEEALAADVSETGLL